MARPTFEACESCVIPVGSIIDERAAGSLRILRFAFTLKGDRPFVVSASLDMGATPFVELAHVERRSDGQPVRYRITLNYTAQPFGGRRWWFLCPVTGRIATKLILPRGGRRFASRGAWNLGYATQRAGRLEKISRRAGRVYRSIGGIGNWRDGLPDKPRWMRWRTYSRRVLALRALIAQYNATWAAEVFRRLPHLKRQQVLPKGKIVPVAG